MMGNSGNKIQYQASLIQIARVDVGVTTGDVTKIRYWQANDDWRKPVNITKYGLRWKQLWANEKPFIYRSYNTK